MLAHPARVCGPLHSTPRLCPPILLVPVIWQAGGEVVGAPTLRVGSRSCGDEDLAGLTDRHNFMPGLATGDHNDALSQAASPEL